MPFQKGQSGNPKGRQAEKPFRDALRMELAAAGEDHKSLRKIAKKLISEANKGNMAAMKEIADRMDGKAAQSLTVGGDQDNPLQFEYIERRIVKPKK